MNGGGHLPDLEQLSESQLLRQLEDMRLQMRRPAEPGDREAVLEDLLIRRIEAELQNRALRKTQRRLERVRDRYVDLYDLAPIGYLTLDRKGLITEINLTAARMLGEPRSALIGRAFAGFLDKGASSALFRHLNEVFSQAEVQVTELLLRLSQGTGVRIRMESVARKGREGTGIACRSALIDVTAQKRTEEALRESEDRYRNLFEHSPEAILVNRNEQIMLVNPAALRLFGAREAAQLIGCSEYELYHRDFHPLIREMRHRRSELTAAVGPSEEKVVRLDGRIVDVEVLRTPVHFDGRLAVHVMLRDISKRRAQEQRVLEAGVAERERIGREIHDGIGQQLTALGLMISRIRRHMSPGQGAEEVDELSDQLARTLRAAKALARGLLPVTIESGELAEALAALTYDTQRTSGIACQFEQTGPLGRLDEPVNVHLYRIAQEALNNAVKHSQCDSIAVSLHDDGSCIILRVRDDGVGLDSSGVRPIGVGLQTMRSRAGLIGAMLSVRAGANAGTTVECSYRRPNVD